MSFWTNGNQCCTREATMQANPFNDFKMVDPWSKPMRSTTVSRTGQFYDLQVVFDCSVEAQFNDLKVS